MNMAKLGTVSRSLTSWAILEILHQYKALRLMPYTLCEVGKTGIRNGSRNSFGFYIPVVVGSLPASPVLVTTGHLSQFDTFGTTKKTVSTPYGLRLADCFSPKNNCSTFSGGCHE